MKEWTNNVRVSLAFSTPSAELDTNLFMQVTREDLVHFYFQVGQPEHSHIRLCTLHSVVGYYPALLFLALDQRWLQSTLMCRGVILIPCRSTRYLVAIGGNRFGDRNVGLVGHIRMSIVTSVCLVPRVQSVSFDGGRHGNDRHPKGVVKNDVVFKCSHCGDGQYQRLDVCYEMDCTLPKPVAKLAI